MIVAGRLVFDGIRRPNSDLVAACGGERRCVDEHIVSCGSSPSFGYLCRGLSEEIPIIGEWGGVETCGGERELQERWPLLWVLAIVIVERQLLSEGLDAVPKGLVRRIVRTGVHAQLDGDADRFVEDGGKPGGRDCRFGALFERVKQLQ